MCSVCTISFKFLCKLNFALAQAVRASFLPTHDQSITIKRRWNKKRDKLCLILFISFFIEFIKLPLWRRYRAAAATKNIYKKPFIPNAITLWNTFINTIHTGTMLIIVVITVHVLLSIVCILIMCLINLWSWGQISTIVDN